MGVAGLVFEPQASTFENEYNIQMLLKWFFDFSTIFRFSNLMSIFSAYIQPK